MNMRNPLLSVTLLLVGAPVFAAAPLYVETEILAPPGAQLTAAGLNNNGDVAASANNGTGYVYLHHSHTMAMGSVGSTITGRSAVTRARSESHPNRWSGI
jgi:hypothetical protein